MHQNINKIILMGPQGSGKTTQGKKIAAKLDVDLVVAGNILRKEIRAQTDLGRQIDQVVNTGNLIPNELMIDLMFKTIDFLGDDKGFILDGFPRDIEQSQALDLHYPVDKVFNIEISDKEAIRRLSKRRVCSNGHVFHLEYNPPKKANICDICGNKLFQRKDDKPGIVKNRLSIYRQETSQLLDYYNKQQKLVVFNGEQSIEAVTKDIFDYLKNVR